MGQGEEIQESSKKTIEDRQKIDNDDYNNAMADRPTGRARTFGFERNHSEKEALKKQRKHALEMALYISASYAKLYQETLHNLHQAENAVYEAQVDAALEVNEAHEILEQTLDSASTTENGTKVFRAQDGSVYTQDGRLLEGDELAGIKWQENAPSWEEYQKQRQDLEEKQLLYDRMKRHEQSLNKLRAEMEDKDNPPSEERLEEIRNEIENIFNDTKVGNEVQSKPLVEKALPSMLPDLGL